MSDEYKNSGQTGAFGENAQSHDNTFNQYNAETINITQAAPTYTSLHQLPPPSADFVGREKEMAELLQALESGGVTISGLQGMGGIGKTALALKLAEQLKPKYPDAQFYLDLKGVSKEPLTSTQAMAHVIHSYHPAAKLPEDDNGLRGLYSSVLEGKRALLLMDNAASTEQVEPLLPPTTCTLLVTSRFHLTLDGLYSRNLDILGPEDAKTLLLKIAPRIGKSANKIASLCGYLPLALKVAANALKKAINLTPQVYVKRLEKATKRLELVEASIKLSYDLLSIKMQRLWQSLAVFPNTFDDNAVAALWGMQIEDAQESLTELISYSLIEWNEKTGRYHLHDLVRLFADNHLTRQESFDAKKAHATFFWNLLTQADELFMKGNDEMIRGLSLFDLERENIGAGQAWAASLIEKVEYATQLSMVYFFAGVHILTLRLHPRESITWLEVTLKTARLLEDRFNEGVAFTNLGKAYVDLGEYRKATELLQQALLINRETNNRQGECVTLGNLGSIYLELRDNDTAIEHIEQSLIIAREIGDTRSENNALVNLGSAYWQLGKNDKAIEVYEQGLEIARKIGDHISENSALTGLGNAYWSLNEPLKSIEYYEQAIVSAREIGDLRGEGRAFFNSALSYDRLGDRVQAISLAEIALTKCELIESPLRKEVRSTLEKWKSEQA